MFFTCLCVIHNIITPKNLVNAKERTLQEFATLGYDDLIL